MSDLKKLSAKIATRGAAAVTVAMLLSAASAFAAGNVDEARSTLTSIPAPSRPVDTIDVGQPGTDRVLTQAERAALVAEKEAIRKLKSEAFAAMPKPRKNAKAKPLPAGSRPFQLAAAADLIDAASLVSRGARVSANQLVEMTLVSTDASIKPAKLWNLLMTPIDRVGKPLIDLSGDTGPVDLFEDLRINGISS